MKTQKKSQKLSTHLVNFELKREKKREFVHENKKVRTLFNFKLRKRSNTKKKACNI